MKVITLFLAIFLCASQARAGKKMNVLFIGNSYTYVNSMPQIVADIAATMGDTLVWEMEAPGGYDFISHYAFHPPTIAKIQAGKWDYVVLQEQSQIPAIPTIHANVSLFPYARGLDSLVNSYNSCAETMFYMTWGRKNGDSYNCTHYSTTYSWPHFCTYNAMDSVIRLRYRMMADSNHAVVSPAGAVWRYIRTYYPSIELYDADESHPSQAGSYAVACCFYTALFKKDPAAIVYNYTLSSTDADNIRLAAQKVVYDSMLYWHIGQYRTEALFSYSVSANTVNFTNSSLNSTSYVWHFGDGQTDTTSNPMHSYAVPGNYNAMLIATNIATGCSDTTYALVTVVTADANSKSKLSNTFTLMPNPCNGVFTVHAECKAYIITILDVIGHVVYHAKSSDIVEIDIHNQQSGIYNVCIANDNNVWRTFIVLK